jgi:16S rRNA G966 N2-methylase RsmD
VETINTFSRSAINLEKMGYYPTSPEDCNAIATHFYCREAVALDPCCGTGKALVDICESISPDYLCTVGIEIEPEKAAHAQDKLDIILNNDFFNLSIEKSSFGLVFLNPPYYQKEQLHQGFIEKSTKLLAKNGQLVLIIPEYEVKGETADFLATHYGNIEIYKAIDKTFHQVIIFGTKKDAKNIEKGNYLSGMAQEAEEISQETSISRLIPSTKDLSSIRIMSIELDPVLLESICEKHNEDWKALISIIPDSNNIRRPLLPLRRGHLAQLLASGFVDGVVEHPETKERFLIKGTTTRVEEVLEETEEETRVIYRDIVTIKMMDQQGNITEIKQ